jgi:hypothetical protein
VQTPTQTPAGRPGRPSSLLIGLSHGTTWWAQPRSACDARLWEVCRRPLRPQTLDELLAPEDTLAVVDDYGTLIDVQALSLRRVWLSLTHGPDVGDEGGR